MAVNGSVQACGRCSRAAPPGFGAAGITVPGWHRSPRSLAFRWSTCLGQRSRVRRTSSVWRPTSKRRFVALPTGFQNEFPPCVGLIVEDHVTYDPGREIGYRGDLRAAIVKSLAADAETVANAERFRAEGQLAKLAVSWPATRLVEIYNSLQARPR